MHANCQHRVVALALLVIVSGLGNDALCESETSDGTIHVSGFDLPVSGLLPDASRAILKRLAGDVDEESKNCPPGDQFNDAVNGPPCFLPLVTRMRSRYRVAIEPATLNGVEAEIITPSEGVSSSHQHKVLINLHGGAFMFGAKWVGEFESIPIAAVGKFKIVSVNYRMARQYHFPAASEDTEAVYRALLKTYRPQDIGIFGCSAGGMLTAQVTAWLQWRNLPRPGAVGMFCGAGMFWADGDSGRFDAAQFGLPLQVLDPHNNPYLKDVDVYDSLAYPAQSDETMARFPPSLLISSTRDVALSSVAYTHSRLVALGVDAELHVWEGMGHEFFGEPDLPESREAYDVITRFFDRRLGRKSSVVGVSPEAKLESALSLEVQHFVEADTASHPRPCQVLFVGSSSFVKWVSLAKDMAPLPIINRGFGGSHIEYVNRWFHQIVAPYHPRAIVFYDGENDIAEGKSVDRVIADFDHFMQMKSAALGTTPVYFISIKPSRLRWWQFELQSRVNRAIQERAEHRTDLHYIDVVAGMLDDGKPKDLFGEDHLHMTPKGYEIWTQAVRAALVRNTEAETNSCFRSQDHGL